MVCGKSPPSLFFLLRLSARLCLFAGYRRHRSLHPSLPRVPRAGGSERRGPDSERQRSEGEKKKKKRKRKKRNRRSAHCVESVVWSPGPGPSLQVKRAPLCAVSTPPPANLKWGQRPHCSAGLWCCCCWWWGVVLSQVGWER